MVILGEQPDRQAPAAALCESVGGKLIGLWGAMGQPDYQMFAVIEVAEAASRFAGIEYRPATGWTES